MKMIKENGLLLKTNEEGDKRCIPDLITDDFNELPVLDVCFLAVKSYDLEEVLNIYGKTIVDLPYGRSLCV